MLFKLNIQMFATQSEGLQGSGGWGGGSAQDAQDNSGNYGGGGVDRGNYGGGGSGSQRGDGSTSTSTPQDTPQYADIGRISFSDALGEINAGLDDVPSSGGQGLTGSGSYSQAFSERFGHLDSLESFSQASTDLGFGGVREDELSRMTQTEAQDYIDQRALEMTQRFEAMEKLTTTQNIGELQQMQVQRLQRITEQYDPTTATLEQRQQFNASLRGLQEVGLGQSLTEDLRVGDYAKLGASTLSALSGNPLGIASTAYGVSQNLTNIDRTALGELAEYGRFTDPSLKGISLSDAELDRLGKSYADIEDFAKTVRTAEENQQLDKYIEAYQDDRKGVEAVYNAQSENVERIAEEGIGEVDQGTDQSQGGTAVSDVTSKTGILFNRDVSNKGLGDVVSVFDQIEIADEDDLERRQSNARARLGLAGLWR